MSNITKQIKIKKADGQFETLDIGASAANIDVKVNNQNQNLQTAINEIFKNNIQILDFKLIKVNKTSRITEDLPSNFIPYIGYTFNDNECLGVQWNTNIHRTLISSYSLKVELDNNSCTINCQPSSKSHNYFYNNNLGDLEDQIKNSSIGSTVFKKGTTKSARDWKFTLTITDIYGNIDSKTINVSYSNPIYYGVIKGANLSTSELISKIKQLPKIYQNSKQIDTTIINFNSDGLGSYKYYYYAIPSRILNKDLTNPTFTFAPIGGLSLSGGVSAYKILQDFPSEYTNGLAEQYTIYRSDYPDLGNKLNITVA